MRRGRFEKPSQSKMIGPNSRRVVERFLLILTALLLWHYFSPWTVVVLRRGDSLDTPNSGKPGPNETTGVVNPAPVESAGPKEPLPKGKDSIEQIFGRLEHEYLKAVKSPAIPPSISRDDSIKMIYESKGPDAWLKQIEGQDDHGLMALTKATQRYLYQKQNPVECDGQKFLVLNKLLGDDAFGLGAVVQRLADYLSIAIQTNSILLYAMDTSPGEHFISEPADSGGASAHCGRSFDCIFQRLSNCTSKAQKGLDSNTRLLFTGDEVDLDVDAYLEKHKYPIPPLFESALKTVQPDISGEMLKYWWRAQAAGYIMRLNGEAARRLKEFRLGGGDTKQLGIQWDVNGDPKDVELPFPMPEGTISMHVRHGDKGSEMRLVPFNDYVVRAEKFTAENPLGSWKRAFLSTEDPNVVEQMKSMARISDFSTSGSNARWTWYWSDIPRINSGPETQLKEFGNRTDLTIKWMLQLVMAVECDVFVGTRGSGWNRLIDGLRCVWLGSCKQPFLEVGFEHDWLGYGP